MRYTNKLVFIFFLACSPLLAQQNPSSTLHDALVLEQQGQFDSAVNTINLLINSHQLNGAELGRAYIMLGFAYREEEEFNDAQFAFEHSLQILEHDPDHIGDYATALNDYAGLYGDAGQLEAADGMWLKALHLRKQLGDHAAAMRSLMNLAELALIQKRLHEAKEYLRQATDEAKSAAQDLTDDDLAKLYETKGWIELISGHASAAVTVFQRALDLSVRTRGAQHWIAGWEHILRGRAYAQAGDINSAMADMHVGLAILDHALGRTSLKYSAAELTYAQVLDRAGSHAEAARLRTAAGMAIKNFYGNSCTGCTINVAAFH
jgi:tetratricopeptide (TPR) repeat protein